MQGDAAQGRTLFASKGCVLCHAINEVGGTSAPLDPEAALGDVDGLDFVARMWRGAEAMILMQQQELGVQIDFTGQELADIIAFVHDPKAAEVLGAGACPGYPEAGREIVRSWCTACHVVDLEGTGADAGCRCRPYLRASSEVPTRSGAGSLIRTLLCRTSISRARRSRTSSLSGELDGRLAFWPSPSKLEHIADLVLLDRVRHKLQCPPSSKSVCATLRPPERAVLLQMRPGRCCESAAT